MTYVGDRIQFVPLDTQLYQIQAVVYALAAIILVIATRGRLGYSEEDETGE